MPVLKAPSWVKMWVILVMKLINQVIIPARMAVSGLSYLHKNPMLREQVFQHMGGSVSASLVRSILPLQDALPVAPRPSKQERTKAQAKCNHRHEDGSSAIKKRCCGAAGWYCHCQIPACGMRWKWHNETWIPYPEGSTSADLPKIAAATCSQTPKKEQRSKKHAAPSEGPEGMDLSSEEEWDLAA